MIRPEYSQFKLGRHQAASPCLMRQWREQEFAQLQHTFERTGGLVCGDDLACKLGERLQQQPVSQVARWIVSHKVLSFAWRSRMLLPVFQFDEVDLTPLPSVSAAVAELASTLGNWEMALWFVEPNHLLDEATPMDALKIDAAAVLSAARAERYFIRG